MIRFNDAHIIGIDHGYGNLKTANTVTASGVKVHDIEPPFKKELLEFEGKFICIGENHKSFTADKTTDMDNYESQARRKLRKGANDKNNKSQA